MAATSPEDIKNLIDRYCGKHDWGRDRAHTQNTSKVIRQLVRTTVETGSVDEYTMRAVYSLCQNDDVLQPENRRERIDNLDTSSTAESEIKERIDGETGIVGKEAYSVPIEGHEEEAFNPSPTTIRSDSRDEIDSAIGEFASLRIEEIRNRITFPALYLLHPIKYPISSRRSWTGMQKLFGYEMSGWLTSYLTEVEKFREVHANYPFKNDLRHLDGFFNWIEEQEPALDGQSTKPVAEISGDTNLYWVNRHNPPEIGKEYLRAKTDGLWHHSLDKLSIDGVVLHNFDDELMGTSITIENTEAYTFRGEEYYWVGADLRSSEEPVPAGDDLKKRLGQDRYRIEGCYSIDENGNLNEAHLADLSRPAAEFLLDQIDSIEESETLAETSGSPGGIW